MRRNRVVTEKNNSELKFLIPFGILWLVGAMSSFALVGVIIWAIINLVTHFTS